MPGGLQGRAPQNALAGRQAGVPWSAPWLHTGATGGGKTEKRGAKTAEGGLHAAWLLSAHAAAPTQLPDVRSLCNLKIS